MPEEMTVEERAENARKYLAEMAEKESRAVTLRGGGRRCAIQQSAWIDGWWVSYSPRNDNSNAEGDWGDWVALAHEILAYDAKVKAGEASRGIPD